MLTLFSVKIGLAVIGLPVAFAMILAAVVYMLVIGDPAIKFVPQRMVAALDTFPLLAVPFFIFAGSLMNATGVTERIFNFARLAVGHRTGGLGHVNVLASLLFSGMSGSSIADAAGLGQVEIKAMRDAGFNDDFAGAVTAGSCIIGPLVPPSIPMVIYGVVANVSIGALFLGGILPGLLAALILMLVVWWLARRRGYPVEERSRARDLGRAALRAFPPLLAPVIIIGSIFTGRVTPTEAAVLASTYAILLGLFYGTLTPRVFARCVNETVSVTAATLALAAAAGVFGYLLARLGAPSAVAALFGEDMSPLLALIAMQVVLFFLGMLLDTAILLFLVVPLLMPTVLGLGIDPVHFGVVSVFNMMIGILTPPFGGALFVVSRISGIPYHRLAVAIIPFILPLMGLLILMILIPEISTGIPQLLR